MGRKVRFQHVKVPELCATVLRQFDEVLTVVYIDPGS